MYIKTIKYAPDEIRDKDGKWINSSVFREEALNFKKNGYYCPHRKGTVGYKKYWDEQLRRCIEGYEVAGHKITGNHYHYLNFTEIKIVEENPEGTSSVKSIEPPDFWDGDFDYFWMLDIARFGVANPLTGLMTPQEIENLKGLSLENRKGELIRKIESMHFKCIPHYDYLEGGNHMIVGKSRRKGFSYKNGAICVNTYNTIRNSITLIGAFDKKYLYPRGTMAMASEYMDYLNKYTAFFKGREFVNRAEHKRASFEEKLPNGTSVESGYMSEVIAITFADNPDAARGKDAYYVLLEEAGAFPNLEKSYKATQPGLTAGKYVTGQIIVFGTGGDMEGGTADFAKMFYSPFEFGFMPFKNIWDDNAQNTYCGYFHPVNLNMEGFYDEQGNSDMEAARKYELDFRKKLLENSSSSKTLESRVQEYCLKPSEAFLTVSVNDFPVVELRNRLNLVEREKLYIKNGQPCHIFPIADYTTKEGQKISGGITYRPDLHGELKPLWHYNHKEKDLRGAVVIYEPPIENPPPGIYKISYDPYRQDNYTDDRPSLATIYVYKQPSKFSNTRTRIVASFVGRPYDADDANRVAEYLAILYNAEIMHENEVTHVRSYFLKQNKLHLLSVQPDAVISKNIKQSKVARVYGCHMNDEMKDAGEKYIKKWLLTTIDYDENGNPVRILDTIDDPGLLEELIYYNRKGNFDRVMSIMMLMFSIEEDTLRLENKFDAEKDLEDSLEFEEFARELHR